MLSQKHREKTVLKTTVRYPLILITGATGWLGRRVVQALTSGNDAAGLPPEISGQTVRCLVPDNQPAASLDDFDVEVVRGHLNDPAALDQFFAGAEGALVVHLAGIVHPPSFATKVWTTVNVDGTKQIAERAISAGVKRLTVMSSNSPMGANPKPATAGAPIPLFTEDSPYRPYMGYGKSKFMMETFLREQVMIRDDLETTIIRSPWFYGPGQPARQTVFFQMIRQGTFPIFGDGANLRSMGYVDNLANGILLAAFTTDGADDIFWIADETPYSMRTIVETVAKLLSEEFGCTDVKPWRRFPSVIPDGARAVDTILQAGGFYSQKVHVLSEMNLSIACSIEKAKSKLGYQPQIALEEGMRRSIQWCLDSGIEI